MFDAAAHFLANRLPELFAGLPRDEGAFPVQYLGANVPQAWAAASVFRLIAILCGIHARTDRDGSRLYVDPALPDWLPRADDLAPARRPRLASTCGSTARSSRSCATTRGSR